MATQSKQRASRAKPSAGAGDGEGRRERNKREKRARIIAAARELFEQQGYRATTSQQIADAAGIAAGTLFLYARSKEDLLVLVFADEMRALIERAYRSIDADAPFLEQVTALFKRFVAYHARDAAIARELIRETTFLSNRDYASDMIGITQAIVEKIVLFADRAVERGELDPRTERRTLANCLFSLYYQQLQTWLSGYVTRREFERSLGTMLAHVVDGSRRRDR